MQIKDQKKTIWDKQRLPGLRHWRRPSCRCGHLIRTSIFDKYSGSPKTTTHLDHVSHCRTASGINRSNRWTCRVFIILTEIQPETGNDFRDYDTGADLLVEAVTPLNPQPSKNQLTVLHDQMTVLYDQMTVLLTALEHSRAFDFE